MASIYSMAAPGGTIFKNVSDFFSERGIFLEKIGSGLWAFSWLKSSPQSEATVQRNIPGHGAVLVLPTYDDLLMERVTGLIAHECEQLSYVAQYGNVEDWLCDGSMGKSEEERKAAAMVEDLIEGFHDIADTALINVLKSNNLITEQEISTLLFQGDLSDNCLVGTDFLHLAE
ncbi:MULTISPECIES: hypothetical protein [Gammaproteobacteria]|uniref:Uncharacterized protein n=2 Tax=Gammaproteobacteria TaxID=1236 RepID=A0AAX3P1P2_9GAMM|nr:MULTISPECIES: hypothetical protein [Gammaproteobacteria]MDV0844414.1 hypothetical protein [Klebsiella quasipneumoniae subsp. quasipneumoniae]WED79230.1 hypothetical protein PYU98_25090 [Aeromonas allosaccharophila]